MTVTAHRISAYSDGSSGGASKTGIGWGWIVVDWTTEEILGAGSAGEAAGTNNIAELRGAIDGLKFIVSRNLHTGNLIELVSDSTYTLGVASGEFEPTKNLELAAEIRQLAILTQLRTRWIKGHSGDPLNEKCDQLAKAARDKFVPEHVLKRRKRKKDLRQIKKATVKAYKRGELTRPPLTIVQS